MAIISLLQYFPQLADEKFAIMCATASIILHVVNYNLTAQVEHNTRIFTKILGRYAVYYYAVYLVLSALVRDALIDAAIAVDSQKVALLEPDMAKYVGSSLLAFGVLLNLWTLKALGVKGMYNGDSFGHLMTAPVTDGPYTYFSDPQYVGTFVSFVGLATISQSPVGFALATYVGVVFFISAIYVETPHMNKIYSAKGK
eukprot:TRINITY_DN2748_c1_g1_i1.p1 TRINITY_DN2748_c1_g1~~TRINITY_DN2748_c1_g1_i1.p1  ORF type:complete len:199 (-),score=41.81 TRINITY_DN2748_c1_g1_i1:63-659(-)